MVFALDIGTRVVVGVVVEPTRSGWRVRASAVEEHRHRAMLDGQIHDVPAVAEAIARVKAKIEKKVGSALREVAVAAAGRALRTQRARVGQRVGTTRPIGRQEVLALELEAVQESLRLLAKREAAWNEYHCVGYSVVGYWLDGSPIGSPVGQRGSTVEAEVVATFLPRVVVDSLYTAVEAAGLAVKSLTLEPIAAGALVITPAMRQLNLALVDIGAGTSDVAIARDGALAAFGMVPLAGDEITECICRELLVDYHEGEKIKKRLCRGGEIAFRDVVGQLHRVSAGELLALVDPVISQIAKAIAETVIELNGRPPQAVILVGGGSLTPGLPEKIAGFLELTPQRVAVRGLEAVPQVSGSIKGIELAQAVTPVGIALASQSNHVLDFAQVLVNRRPVRLLKGGGTTVSDALLAAGIGLKELYGKMGRGLTVEVNGEIRIVRGGTGRPAEITVNGRPASLETRIGYGDEIEVGAPVPGEPAQARVKDVLPPFEEKKIYFEDREVVLSPTITMNGRPVSLEDEVLDGARIHYNDYPTVEAVLAFLHRSLKPGEVVTVNGQAVDLKWPVRSGDRIAVVAHDTGPNNLAREEAPQGIKILFNGRPLQIPVYQGASPILTDVFRYVEAPAAPPPGKSTLVVRINGRNAEFTDPLKEGDEVFVGWE